MIIAENKEFGVWGIGQTVEEAEADLRDTLQAEYRVYAEEADDNMDKYARELARRYRKRRDMLDR